MRMTILCIFTLWIPLVLAQSGAEEAIILNQEMQFLEDSAQGRPMELSEAARSTTPLRRATEEETSLEKTYFGDEAEDSVSTRLASPKKRGL